MFQSLLFSKEKCLHHICWVHFSSISWFWYEWLLVLIRLCWTGRAGPQYMCWAGVSCRCVTDTSLLLYVTTLKLDVNKHTIIQSGSRTLCRTLDCWFCSEEKLLVFQSSLKPLSETIKRAAGCRVSGAATCSCTVSDCASWALTDRVILGLNLHHLLI